VAGEPLRLTVLLEIERPFGGGTVKIKRVFDRAVSAPAVAPPATQPSAPAGP
jgi:hypothetical protein